MLFEVFTVYVPEFFCKRNIFIFITFWVLSNISVAYVNDVDKVHTKQKHYNVTLLLKKNNFTKYTVTFRFVFLKILL